MAYHEIEKNIRESFKQIKEILKDKVLDYKIFFPNYSSGEMRCSEQELKCLFLSNLSKTDFLYTVETPSKYPYRFKNKKPLVLLDNKKSDDTYKSSMIDVSIYDKSKKLLSHMEFKHGTCSVFPIQKDFLKMICESESVDRNYFVHYVEVSDKKTREAVFEKYKIAIKAIRDSNITNLELEQKLCKVEVYILFVGLDEVYHFPLNLLNDNLEKYKDVL